MSKRIKLKINNSIVYECIARILGIDYLRTAASIQDQLCILSSLIGNELSDECYEKIKLEAYQQGRPNAEYILEKLKERVGFCYE